jgi:uncharacterized membrane protein YfcA
VLLLLFAFLAGFVDAIAGGGGLIQIPALFVFLPSDLAQRVPLVFGTNKFASIWGTSSAATQYLRKVTLDWKAVSPAIAAAFVFSFLGAMSVTAMAQHPLARQILKPIVLVLLILVAIQTYARKTLGQEQKPLFRPGAAVWAGAVAGAVIGFYDGFFGPGTGTFLIFVFIRFFGFDFLHASASAKLVNVATNLAALILFSSTANILFRYAIPMAVCNIAGALVGSRVAILKGNQFVRKLFLLVIVALIARLTYEMLLQGR